MAKHKYTGILAKAAPWDEKEGWHWLTVRLDALFADCRVPEEEWMELAFVLMQRHVPAFQLAFKEKPRVGPRRKTSGADDARLLAEIGRRLQEGQSLRQASQNAALKLRMGSAAAIATRYRRLQKAINSFKR